MMNNFEFEDSFEIELSNLLKLKKELKGYTKEEKSNAFELLQYLYHVVNDIIQENYFKNIEDKSRESDIKYQLLNYDFKYREKSYKDKIPENFCNFDTTQLALIIDKVIDLTATIRAELR